MARVVRHIWPSPVTTAVVKRLDHLHGDATVNCLLTLMPQLFVDSNLTCTTIHRALTRLFTEHRDHDSSIGELFLPVNKCTVENRNHTRLGYLGYLKGRRVAGRVDMNFMVMGHTHTSR